MLTWPERAETPEKTVENVHKWAMARFDYIPDAQRWASGFALNGDHWETRAEIEADLEAGTVRGDCDAFAMMCWMALRRLNEPSRLVYCTTENGQGHLVCEASGWILDNRQPVPEVRHILEQRIGYTWIAKSGFQPGEQWTTAL